LLSLAARRRQGRPLARYFEGTGLLGKAPLPEELRSALGIRDKPRMALADAFS
jgi:hypothetical protein